jgi:hypothetical protein
MDALPKSERSCRFIIPAVIPSKARNRSEYRRAISPYRVAVREEIPRFARNDGKSEHWGKRRQIKRKKYIKVLNIQNIFFLLKVAFVS